MRAIVWDIWLVACVRVYGWSLAHLSINWPRTTKLMHGFRLTHTQSKGVGRRRRSLQPPSNLPSFPRDSSSFWIWFSKTNMATANASSASSCNLGGIMTRSSPIKSSRSKIWSVHARRRRHWKRTHTHTLGWRWLQSGWVSVHGPVSSAARVWVYPTVPILWFASHAACSCPHRWFH